MTSSRLLKSFVLVSVLCASAALWSWHTTGEPPSRWLVRIAFASLVAALVTGVVNPDTRPRMLMRFLAALFALFSLIAVAADVSRPALDGQSRAEISLLQHLQTLAPSFVTALERSVENSIGVFAWNPVLTSILSLPASLIFFVLAVAAGLLGRPRQRIRIFVNDY
jgi:uncharacterized membrane protein YfcA